MPERGASSPGHARAPARAALRGSRSNSGSLAPALSILGGTALLVACVAAAVVARDYDAEAGDLVASLDRHRAVHETLVTLLDGEAAGDAFLLTGEARSAAAWSTLWAEHEAAQRALRTSLAAVTSATELDALEAAVEARERWTQDVVERARAGDIEGAGAAVRSGEGETLLSDVRVRLDRLERAEDERVQRLVDSVAVRRMRALAALAGGGGIALVIAAALFLRAWRDARSLATRIRAAEESEQRFRQIADAAVDLVRIHDRDGRTLYVSPSARRLLGRAPDAVAEGGDAELLPEEDRAAMREVIERLQRGETPAPVVHRFRRADGSLAWFETRLLPIHDDDGALVRWQSASRDVDERVRIESERDERHSLLVVEAEELREASATDALTGLLNRRGLLERGEPLLRAERAAGRTTAVVFADLDGLKAVNDQLGHEMGDRLIRAAADALRAVTREGDLCARVGGDEMVVVACGCDELGVAAFAARLDRVIAAGAAELPFTLSLSIGHALAPASSAGSLEALIATADARMYEVKRTRASRRPAVPSAP